MVEGSIGRIKIRDKRHEADEGVRERRKYKKKIGRHFALVHLSGYYLMLHKDRVEYHCQRVAGEERIMRKHDINPMAGGSAYRFDKLIGRIE